MGERRVGRATAFQWLAGCAVLVLGAVPVAAQINIPPPDPTELDPSAPLDPMPDLGVEWPDMNQPDPEPPPEVEAVTPEAAAEATEEAAERVEDVTSNRRYRWTISGLEAVPEAEDIRIGFHGRSVLEADNDETANAAQIDRRARADAELLAELLRSQGYYDAVVEPGIDASGNELIVTLTAVAGPLYHFESVELPGLDQAAPGEAERLRQAFAVKPGDPVIAQRVIDAGLALQVALGERGFATQALVGQDEGN